MYKVNFTDAQKKQWAKSLEDRLISYARIDTQSDNASPSIPSTAIQYDLLNLLVEELKALGASDIQLTDYANVLATVPGNIAAAPSIAFLGHVDTALEISGKDVKPIVHRNYDGKAITLPDDKAQVIDPERFPYLLEKIGDDLITASGTTLLGADDKSGVAIVMTLAEVLLSNPDIAHGPVRLCFTCDEEIGRGVHENLPADLKADFAYTLDGGKAGCIDFETFSADEARIDIQGVSLHPGASYGKAVNALNLAARLMTRLPQDHMTPATTHGHEGFIHVVRMEGNQSDASIEIILRDFERDGLKEKGQLIENLCQTLREEEPRATISCTINKQYRNMRYWLEKDMRPVQLARDAVTAAGMHPFSELTRGGTDGSRLTELGVPTPNIFTGQQNLHGPLEWISVQDMVRATDTCLQLVQLAVQETKEAS